MEIILVRLDTALLGEPPRRAIAVYGRSTLACLGQAVHSLLKAEQLDSWVAWHLTEQFPTMYYWQRAQRNDELKYASLGRYCFDAAPRLGLEILIEASRVVVEIRPLLEADLKLKS